MNWKKISHPPPAPPPGAWPAAAPPVSRVLWARPPGRRGCLPPLARGRPPSGSRSQHLWTGGQEDRKTGRQEEENRKTGRQEDRKTGRKEERKTGRLTRRERPSWTRRGRRPLWQWWWYVCARSSFCGRQQKLHRKSFWSWIHPWVRSLQRSPSSPWQRRHRVEPARGNSRKPPALLARRSPG